MIKRRFAAAFWRILYIMPCALLFAFGSTVVLAEDATDPMQCTYDVLGNADPVEFTAQWTPVSYALTYIPGDDASLPLETTNPVAYTIESGTVLLVTPTKTDNVFSGWCVDSADCNENERITTYTASAGNLGNHNLYAQWTECAPCNTGTGASCAFTGVENNACQYETSCLTGYDNLQNDGEYNPICDSIQINVILYADCDDPQSDRETIGLLEIGDSVYLNDYNDRFYLQGKHIDTWYTRDDSGSYEWQTNGIVLIDEHLIDVAIDNSNELAICAQFEPDIINLSYDFNGGQIATGATAQTQCLHGTQFNLPVVEDRVGYTFVGWTYSK